VGLFHTKRQTAHPYYSPPPTYAMLVNFTTKITMTIEWGKLFKEMLACEQALWSEKREKKTKARTSEETGRG